MGKRSFECCCWIVVCVSREAARNAKISGRTFPYGRRKAQPLQRMLVFVSLQRMPAPPVG